MNKHTFVVLAYKESEYLEECIKSVTNQKSKSNVVIATSTPNSFINKLAKKYKLDVIVNKEHRNIGGDFDFAVQAGNTELVTVAHQDDLYDEEYSESVINRYEKNKNSIILFTDYYEIKENQKIYHNRLLKIKRILLIPLRISIWSSRRFIKRLSLRFGCPICCPSVTFVKDKINFPLFENEFKANVDWNAWEKLSKEKGAFSYIRKPLMGHRVHEASTTTSIIKENTRTKEDQAMFERFWPKCIARLLNKYYVKAEESNKVS